MAGLIVLALIGTVWAIVGAKMAENRGRSTGEWAALCFFFGIFAVLALAIAGKAEPKQLSD
jgi:hypothetical protein